MSTKNLSRTVIEGGRCGHYKSEVQKRIRSERSASRVFLQTMAHQPDEWEDDAAPRRQPVSPCFADKTSPLYRFLESRVGDAWDAVRSEIFQRFDVRTTPGRHVIFDHLLRDVSLGDEPKLQYMSLRPYFVDDDGRLQKRKRERWRARTPAFRDVTKRVHEVARWLEGRKVGRCGNGFAWYVATNDPTHVVVVWEAWNFVYARCDDAGVPLRHTPLPTASPYRPPPPLMLCLSSFRQSGKLDAGEARYFANQLANLPADIIGKLFKLAPTSV